MIILFDKKENCCGCGACRNVCPRNAISMISDEYGFLYPSINNNICVECGLCREVCAFQKANRLVKKPIATYAAMNRNEEVLKGSTSGGVFPAIATKILNNNGIVFGCAMKNDKIVEHIHIENIKDINKLQGSKYVQSNTNFTFREVKKFLKEGRKVLYTGTPCQIDALKSYLGEDYDNLVTMDLVCHGVPSNQFFLDYIGLLESRNKMQIIDYKFRSKSKDGLCTIGYVEYLKNNKRRKKNINYATDYYAYFFKESLINRDSCYHCPYASSNRSADFTVGDYWGIEEAHPEVNINKAVSLLLANSRKALEILDSLDLDLIRSDLERASRKNKNLCYPTIMRDERNMILSIYKNNGAEGVFRYFNHLIIGKRYIFLLKSMVPIKIKSSIKKVLSKYRNFFTAQ